MVRVLHGSAGGAVASGGGCQPQQSRPQGPDPRGGHEGRTLGVDTGPRLFRGSPGLVVFEGEPKGKSAFGGGGGFAHVLVAVKGS